MSDRCVSVFHLWRDRERSLADAVAVGRRYIELVMSRRPVSARVHARVGGLKAADIARWDGLR